MQHFFSPCHFVRYFTLLLCGVTLIIGFFLITPIAHATKLSGPNVIQGPPIQCLNIGASSSYGAKIVKTPKGSGIQFTLVLYVTVTNPPCPNSFLVTQIEARASVDGTCPSAATLNLASPIIFNGPYGLYPGGGYSQDYIVTIACITENGNQVVPTALTETYSATGTTFNNNVRQNVTSNTKTDIVW
jgi:hypothetical protein